VKLTSLFFLIVFPLVCRSADILTGSEPILIPNSTGPFESLRVDSTKRRLLMAHTGNGTLDIIDLKTETLLKQINTGAAQDCAIDSRKGNYYVSVSREKKLVVISRETLDITKEIFLPGAANGVCVAPEEVKRVFVGDKSGPNLWVVDPDEGKVVSTLPIPRGSQSLLPEDDTSRVYQTIASDSTVLVISAADFNTTVGGAWSTSPAKQPHGFVLDMRKPRRMFVAGTNAKLVVLNENGNVTRFANIATNVHQIAFDPGKNRLYCPGQNGVMTVLDTSNGSLQELGAADILNGVKTVAVDPVTHAVWLAYSASGKCYARKYVLTK
jgi:DNA-binding beta-propeller fold protein YncE